MLKVVNTIRLYLRDLQSRSFVFVFLLCALSVKNERQQRQLGQHLKIEKKSCLSCLKLSFIKK